MDRNNHLKLNGGFGIIKIITVTTVMAMMAMPVVLLNGKDEQSGIARQQLDPLNEMDEQIEETVTLPAMAVQGRLAFQDTETRAMFVQVDEPPEDEIEEKHSLFDILSLYRPQLNEDPENGLGFTEGCEVNTNREFESQLFELINKERKRLGLDLLIWNEDLANAARKHSADMACNDFFSHTNLDDETFNERIAAEGYEYYAAGEDLFAGDDAFNTPTQAFYGWYNSTAHYRIMTHPDLTEAGIGYVYSADSRYGGYFTADFGKPR